MLEYTNIEAERSILGLLIMHNDALIKVSDILKANDFYSDSHQMIYDEILKRVNMEKEVADIITLRPFFDTLPEGGAYLNDLANVSGIMPIRDYAFNLIELAKKRRLLSGLHESIVLLETKSSSDVATKTQDLIASIDSDSKEIDVFDGDGMEQALVDGWKDGTSNIIIPSGVGSLDEMLNGGFTVSKLYTIAAAPGTGKTSLSQQIMVKALEKDYGVLFISMEMERKNIFARFLASFSSINPFRIVINNIFNYEQQAFDNALKKWQRLKSNYFMTEKGNMTLGQIENVLKRKLKANPIKLLVIDYLQIMQLRESKNMSEASLIKENVTGLKNLATKYNISVIQLSQLTKDAIGGRPGLRSLKGSGGIGEDSDCVINLWTDSQDTERKKVKAINIEVAKNRNGSQGDLVVNFDGEYNRFTESNF